MPDDDNSTEPNSNTGGGEPAPTFTQEQVNTMLAEQKRKVQGGYADYDELKAKADKFDAGEDEKKSEIQRAIERAETAERRATDAETQALRADVAAAKGVPASSLAGSDREGLERSADELLSWRDSGRKPPATGSNGYTSGAFKHDDAMTAQERAASAMRSLGRS